MKEKLIPFFFPIFSEIRNKCHPHKYWITFLCVISFIQSTLSIIFSDSISFILSSDDLSNKGGFMVLSVLFVPWYAEMNNIVYEIGLFIFSKILIFGLIIYCSKRMQKKKHVSITYLRIIRGYFLLESKLFLIPVYFRFSLFLEFSRKANKFVLVLFIVYYFMEFIIIYFQSIFFDQFDFVPGTAFHLYEGKSTPVFFFINSILYIINFEFSIIEKKSTQHILSLTGLCLTFVNFYFRVLPSPHISIFGQFIDTAPLSYMFPIIMIRSYTNGIQTIYIFLICLCLAIFYFMVLYMLREQVKKKSVVLFNSFSNQYHSGVSNTGISPYNFITMVRIYSWYKSDPNVFEKFQRFMQLFHNDSYVAIEIIRFSGLFPDKRKQMLEIAKNIKPKSIYHSFLLYVFIERLSGLTNQQTEEDNKNFLKLFYNYKISIIKYWKSRSKRRNISSFKYGINLICLYNETKTEIQSLIYKFPFSTKIRDYYIKFLKITNGDINTIENQKLIYEKLSSNSKGITDPLLHQISVLNPNILFYLTPTEVDDCCYTTVYYSKKNIFQNNQKMSVSQYLNKPLKGKLYSAFLSYLYIIFLLSFFIVLVIEHESTSSQISDKTTNTLTNSIQTFYKSYVNYLYTIINYDNIKEKKININDCFNDILFLDNNLNEFLEKNEELTKFSSYIVASNIDFYNNQIKHENYSVCDTIQMICEIPYIKSNDSYISTVNAIKNIGEQIKIEVKNFANRDRFLIIIILFVFGLIFISIIYFASLYLYLNFKNQNLSKYYDYLCSKQRKKLILNDEIDESWELLHDYINNLHENTLLDNGNFSFINHCENKEEDNFDELELSSHKKYKIHILSFFISYFTIWVIGFFTLFILAVPHLIRVNTQSYDHGFFNNETLPNTLNMISLIDNIYQAIINQTVNNSHIILNLSSKLQDNSFIKAKYNDKYNKNDKSLESYVNDFAKNGLSQESLINEFIPSLFKFASIVFDDYYIADANRKENYHYPAIFFYCIMVSILLIVIFLLGFYNYISINKAIGSIFIFPHRYIELNEKKQNKFFYILPDNLLIITTNSETNKIYYVSDNSINIIGKQSSSLFNKELSEIFHPNNDNNPQYLILNGTNPKVFRVQRISKEQVIHYLLFDDSGHILNYSKEQNIAKQLSLSIPQYFAEQFSDIRKESFTLENSFYILIRLNYGTQFNELESNFKSLSTQLKKSFSNLHILKNSGSCVTLALSSSSIISVFFIVNELICKKKTLLFSILIGFINESKFSLSISKRPYVQFESDILQKFEIFILFLQRGNIAIESNISQLFPENFNNFSFETFENHLISNDHSFKLISFDNFTTLIDSSFQ